MENLCRKSLKLYLDFLRTTSRPRTVEIYTVHITSLIRFLEKQYPEIDSFDKLKRTPHIEGWLHSLAARQPKIKNNTRRKYIRQVRRFFRDLRDWNWPGAPPPKLFRPDDFPPRDYFLPKPLPPEVDAPLMHSLLKKGDMVSLGLVLARRTGLRIGELMGLELNCLVKNSENRFSLRVPLGKLHSERVVPVDKETANLIEILRKKRGHCPSATDPETGLSIEWLLCNEKGMQINRVYYSRTLKAVAKKLGLSENVHPHRLRHTYATELLRCGVSLPGVMKLLGHRTLKMTLRYVAVTDEDLANAFLKASDKARQQYDMLKRFHVDKVIATSLGSMDSIETAFDILIGHIQSIRFDHSDSTTRKKLQRHVESLRRIQGEIPKLLQTP